jgi:outer membrane lipoprotein-sorting protein
MRKIGHILPVLALTASFAWGQEDALQLIKKVAANYAALRNTSYDFELVEAREYPGTRMNRTEHRQRILGSRGKYREETLPSGPLYLFDGEYRWSYNPEREEYTKVKAGNGSNPADLAEFEGTAYRAKTARLLRQETLQLDSGPVVCQVIEVEKESSEGQVKYLPKTYWIDASRNLVMRLSYKYVVTNPERLPVENAVTVSFNKATVGGPVDDSLLRFTPPDGAVQVDHLFFGPKSVLAGADSPHFELKGADGQLISSSTLRGGVLLLQFGSSSNDAALFVLETIYRSFKANGLTAIYVLNSLDAGKRSDGYTVPIAIDPGGTVAKKFGFSGGGMVLIDRLGKIAYGYGTSQNSQELVRALQTLGVW